MGSPVNGLTKGSFWIRNNLLGSCKSLFLDDNVRLLFIDDIDNSLDLIEIDQINEKMTELYQSHVDNLIT